MREIDRLVQRISADEESIGRMSCGEVIAAALVFNKPEWLPEGYKHPVDAVDRLGSNWLEMVIQYRRQHREIK